VNRAYLAAIEGHNWEPEGVERTYQVIEIYSAHGRRTQLEPKGKPIKRESRAHRVHTFGKRRVETSNPSSILGFWLMVN